MQSCGDFLLSFFGKEISEAVYNEEDEVKDHANGTNAYHKVVPAISDGRRANNNMGKYDIETFDDLYADREKIQRNMDALIARRTKLQNRIRRAAPAEKEILRQEKAGVTEQITTLRKQLKLNQGIEARSVQIQERTDLLYANEYRAKEAQQQKKAQRRERDAR